MKIEVEDRMSVVVSILLLFLTAIGEAKLMFVVSAVVLIFGLLFFSGKMKGKLVAAIIIAVGVAVVLSRLLIKV